MQQETITALTYFLNAIGSLYKLIGPLYTTFLIIIFITAKKHSEWQKHKTDKYHFEKMVNEKNKEIERLAEDNNNYRKMYLKQLHGLTEEQYKNIAADDIIKQ